jgi:hypothetical protein
VSPAPRIENGDNVATRSALSLDHKHVLSLAIENIITASQENELVVMVPRFVSPFNNIVKLEASISKKAVTRATGGVGN